METITVKFTDEVSMDIPLEDAVRIIEEIGLDPVSVPHAFYSEVIRFAFHEFVAGAAGELEQGEEETNDE
tara:strand:+ start:736 stop:945 length:210 start_codon:yes stop_codon:yes gene_type:complete